MPPKRTFVYVDGFNLYYRALKGTPYKWLNLKKMCDLALGSDYAVECIKYYTARVSGTIDSGQPKRQQIYISALRSIPEIRIYYGKFNAHAVRMPLQTPLADGTRSVFVIKAEEKGSDVNLASHLVNDAHLKRFEAAAVVSCDTDLVEPIRIVAKDLGLPVCLLPPQTDGSRSLKHAATEVRQIGNNRLKQAQFPPQVRTGGQLLEKPIDW